jgi:hypothetical protein
MHSSGEVPNPKTIQGRCQSRSWWHWRNRVPNEEIHPNFSLFFDNGSTVRSVSYGIPFLDCAISILGNESPTDKLGGTEFDRGFQTEFEQCITHLLLGGTLFECINGFLRKAAGQVLAFFLGGDLHAGCDNAVGVCSLGIAVNCSYDDVVNK